ncbi:hypothetical protein [Variovorax sp. GB1P17]|uniref:hypothetical protein n=1 Tax=Variovorax sp. GB1P17 TaxID=3443740 RepID=UPI003F48C623
MKPEAKRNEEKRRRARARIHGKYKAVGVNLIPKGHHVVQAPTPLQRLSGTDPDAVQLRASRPGKRHRNAHSIDAAGVVGIDGMKKVMAPARGSERDVG